MGLGSTLQALSNSSTAHIKALEAKSTNLSNVMNPDHNRLDPHYKARISEGKATGISIDKITRQFNQSIFENLSVKKAGHAEASIKDEMHTKIQTLFGTFGDKKSTSNQLTKLFTQFSTLKSTPMSPQSYTNTINAAKDLAKTIKGMADAVQDLRTECDHRIERDVEEFNGLLKDIANLNKKVARHKGVGGDANGLRDQRDGLLKKLAAFVPIKSEESKEGFAYVQTTTGHPLVISIEARTLSFTKAQKMNANMALSSGELSGLINSKETDPAKQDVSHKFKEGELRGLLTLRDETLPSLQSELDNWVATLTKEINAIHSEGSPYPAPTQVTGVREFTGDAEAFAGTGTWRVAVTDRTTDKIISYADIDLATIGTVGDLKTAIETAGVAVATSYSNGTAGKLVIDSGNADHGISMVSLGGATETTSGLSMNHFLGMNLFFTTSSTTTTGIANTLAVNSDLVTSPGLIARTSLTQGAITLGTTEAYAPGDTSTLKKLEDLYTAKISFAAAGTLTSTTTSLTNYSSFIVGSSAQQSASAKEQMKSAEIDFNQAQKTLAGFSGVNLQEELMSISNTSMAMNTSNIAFGMVREAQHSFQRALGA